MKLDLELLDAHAMCALNALLPPMRPGDPRPDVALITRTAFEVALAMAAERQALIEANDEVSDASDRARRGDGSSFLIG